MADNTFTINTAEVFPIINFFGYCTDESLETLRDEVIKLCENDKNHMVFDFSSCKLVNSLGLATLLKALLVVQDFEGKVVITGVDAAKKKFFSLTGIFSISESADDANDGIRILSSLAQ